MSQTIYIPEPARKVLQRYEPNIRARLHSLIAQRYANKQGCTWDDLFEMASKVIDELTVERVIPQPDPDMVRESLEAFHKQDFYTTKEWVHDLRERSLAIAD